MAEIENKISSTIRPETKKNKKHATRVDLTPMVDLGFLLITFFIFSTTMNQPTAFNLSMPKDTSRRHDSMNVKESGVLTLIPGENNIVYYYFKKDPSTMQSVSYKNVRDIILNKKRNTEHDDLFIIIKPAKEASFANVVNILDEMNINDISRYAMAKISDQENGFLHNPEIRSGN